MSSVRPWRWSLAVAVIGAALLPRPARAEAPTIAVVVSPSARALGDPLLLALRLEFPDRRVELARGAPDAPAVVRVDRTAIGLRVRVEERSTGVSVEREIAVDASGDEPAAHAAALLARSLLGMALLYRADHGRPPPDRPSAARAGIAREVAGRERDVEGPSTAQLFALTAGAVVSVPFEADPARPGGRLALSVRLGELPLEAGFEVTLLASQEFRLDEETTAHREGVPFGPWLRARMLRGPVVELVPGVGVVLESATVQAGPRSYSDWNTALGGEVRARLRVLGALQVEAGLRGQIGLGTEEYRWEAARVFGVGGSAWGADAGIAARMP